MAKLPADLPENWTSGQIISPNGTEVGLDAKHGYNYLMKQVNAAQTGVNTLNDNMTGVAQESTLQGVKTDVENLSTAAAKEATLQTVKTNVAQVQTDVSDLSQNVNDFIPIWQHTDTTVDTVASRIGTTTDTNGSQTAGTVMGKLNAVQGQVGQFNFSDGPVSPSNEVVLLNDKAAHETTGRTQTSQVTIPSGVDSAIRVRVKLKVGNSGYTGYLLVSKSTTAPTTSTAIGKFYTSQTTFQEGDFFVSASPGETLYFWIYNSSSSVVTVTQTDLVVSYAPSSDEVVQTINADTHTLTSGSSFQLEIGQFTIPDGINGTVRFKTKVNTSSSTNYASFTVNRLVTTNGTTNSEKVAETTVQATTPAEVYIDVDVSAGQVFSFYAGRLSYYDNLTQSMLTVGYNPQQLVNARMVGYPLVQQGYLKSTSLNYTDKDNDVDMYYASVTLPKPVSSNNIVLFMPIGSSASSQWYTPGFGRVVGTNELRLYSPYNDYSSSFRGYWYVVDFGGAN